MCRRRFVAALFAFILLPAAVAACIWDYDTLKMERQRFPGTLEIITGKFLRHSPAFYEWRVQDRLAKLAKDPNRLSDHDDLAAAYDKLGQTEKAIEVMLKKEKLKPGLYETEANLGAFYMLSGQWEKGLERVNKALAINPNAHFGREKYQKLLGEYVLSKMKDGKLALPMARPDLDADAHDFVSAIAPTPKEAVKAPNADVQAAITGVSGMIRFARHDSPILLEALGDLLLAGRGEDAKQLAARAYLRASYSDQDAAAKDAYRRRAAYALNLQIPPSGEYRHMRLEELEPQLKNELAEANAWNAKIEADERRWIAKGTDPEKEFDRVYYQEPSVTQSEVSWLYDLRRHFNSNATAYLLGGILLGLLAVPLMLVILVRRSRRSRAFHPSEVPS